MAENDIPALPCGAVLTGRRRYVIEQVLGAGGFGITYLANTEMTLDNFRVTVRVAVKEHFMGLYNERSATGAVTTPGSPVIYYEEPPYKKTMWGAPEGRRSFIARYLRNTSQTAAMRQAKAAKWFQWSASPRKNTTVKMVNTVKVITSWITLSCISEKAPPLPWKPRRFAGT